MCHNPLQLHSWPRAILHLDADAFFASVEQSLHPELRGKPVITGAERGIVAAASYEAKALGIQRGIPLTEAAQRCPELIMLPSDYESYSLFSQQIFAIMRRFTPVVEEYSIDEAFADLTGLRRHHHQGYEGIAKAIQQTVMQELDIGVSVGLSLTKGLAKLCSKFRKPKGFTAVPGPWIHRLLERTPLQKVWGIGPNTTALLQKFGCTTAWDFVNKPEQFAQRHLGKIGLELWHELRGDLACAIDPTPKTDYASISKTKTFAPASRDPHYLFAQCLRNLESALIKARRYQLAARGIILFLKRQDFTSEGREAVLSRPVATPLDCTTILRQLFAELFQPGRYYRATGIILSGLQPGAPAQFDLFEDPVRAVKTAGAAEAIDEVNAHYGKHTVFLGEGLCLGQTAADRLQAGRRGQPTDRRRHRLPGETPRQHLNIPFWRSERLH